MMLPKLLADENVPLGIVMELSAREYDITRIPESAIGASDEGVLALATSDRRAVLTFDSDFGTITFRDGFVAPFGIVYCRATLSESRAIAGRIADVLALAGDLADRIVVINDRGYRLRALPGSETER